MSVPYLNNAQTQDNYVDSLTVVFTRGRPAFSLHVFNAAIMYRLATLDPLLPGGVNWETGEHFLTISLSTFDSPLKEGLPANQLFAGVQIRSAAVGVPARVTVA